jgi:uncharacterized phage-associated protein
MRSAFDIVPHFLSWSYSQNHRYSITPLKLQKLLYYAQAWHLVFQDQPLFGESIEAWIHGPVIPVVYQRYKQYGYKVIPELRQTDVLSLADQETLNLVCQNYGPQDAKVLEHLTHSEFPWLEARTGIGQNQSCNRKISLESMGKYYKQFVVDFDNKVIDREAWGKKKGAENRTSIDNIISGLDTILDVGAVRSKSSLTYSSQDFQSALSDWEAISSDWEEVGNLIEFGLDQFRVDWES